MEKLGRELTLPSWEQKRLTLIPAVFETSYEHYSSTTSLGDPLNVMC